MRTWSLLGATLFALLAGCGGSDDGAGDETPLDAAPDSVVESDAGADSDTGGDGAAGDGSENEASADGGVDGESEASTEDAASDDAPVSETGPEASASDAGCKNATLCALADEQRAADRMEALVNDPDPTALPQFLTAVPKGGDLHMHLSGAIYAETYMEWARAETLAGTTKYCINNTTLALATSCSSGVSPVPSPGDALFDQVVRAWSMKDFIPGAETGHDHFFATFGKYGAISGSAHHDDCLADVMERAESENQIYLEPMLFSNSTANSKGSDVWQGGTLTTAALPGFHAALLADAGWPASVNAILNDIQKAETGARQILGCGGANPSPACRVQFRFMVYISRSGGGPGVFAQMVAAFEAAKVEPRLVALNLVGPEDGTTALNAYDRQMEMLGYLHGAYAGSSPLHISLHAGELAPKYMPPGYTISGVNHIRKAIQIAHAERIGHGVDVLGETDSDALLAEMKQRDVMVEIGLSSNIQILEVSGDAHPLGRYIQEEIPVALMTDDQGVSRSSMAGEYFRAVMAQGLDYKQLKKLARTSLHKSFAQGQSLFTSIDSLKSVPECAPTVATTYGDPPTPACKLFLDASPRASLQWELERRFREFEAAQ